MIKISFEDYGTWPAGIEMNVKGSTATVIDQIVMVLRETERISRSLDMDDLLRRIKYQLKMLEDLKGSGNVREDFELLNTARELDQEELSKRLDDEGTSSMEVTSADGSKMTVQQTGTGTVKIKMVTKKEN